MEDKRDKAIERPQYERALMKTLYTSSIKVLTGIRRCGKSTLLKAMMKKLLDDGVSAQHCFYMKFDSHQVPLEPTAAWLDEVLLEYVQAHTQAEHLYFFLDEIQEVPGWERPIRRLHESGKAHIYITGSNAFLLSSDLATYLSGRYIEIPVFPLSFKEFIAFVQGFDKQADRRFSTAERAFEVYLRFGGMPGLFAATDFTEEEVARELSAIRDTVLLNDVAKRFAVRDIDLLEKLLRYVYTTSGNLFSSNKVAGTLTSMGRKTNTETVDNYLRALARAFALYECPQVGLKGKAILQAQRKYFAPDTGLRNLATGFSMQDIGYQLENIVYMELLRRGYQVNVGVLAHGEVDFVAEKQSERIYIQVCETLLDEKTREREQLALNDIGDSYPKLILTRDAASVGTTKTGIQIKLLFEWLLES